MTPSPSGSFAKVSDRFSFHVGQPSVRIFPDSHQWHDALPLCRHDLALSLTTVSGQVSYGDYFTAVSDYLVQNGTALLRVAEQALNRRLPPEKLTGIQIHLVKHGAFYHPAMILLSVDGDRLPMVINVAVSEAGRERLPEEAAYLDHLRNSYPDVYIPAVFGTGVGHTTSGQSLPMFAGQWLDHYYEVHQSAAEATGMKQCWSVWDTDQGAWRLTDRQTAQLFHQTAFILTYYFDPHTLCAIRQWHNAAGDFVVRRKGDDIDVRLIAVRSYTPLIRLDDDETIDLETLLETLTLFLMQTAMWLRIDRLDGVDELVWADERVLTPIWNGFVEGLKKMAAMNAFPAEFVSGTAAYLANHSARDLLEIGLQITSRYPADLPEAALMRDRLPAHAEQLAAVIEL